MYVERRKRETNISVLQIRFHTYQEFVGLQKKREKERKKKQEQNHSPIISLFISSTVSDSSDLLLFPISSLSLEGGEVDLIAYCGEYEAPEVKTNFSPSSTINKSSISTPSLLKILTKGLSTESNLYAYLT